jgi:hypothetical protein
MKNRETHSLMVKNKLPWAFGVPWRWQRIMRLACYFGKHLAQSGRSDGSWCACDHCGITTKGKR